MIEAQLKEAIQELDYNRVNWSEKHMIIDLKEKGEILLKSLTIKSEVDRVAVKNAALKYLTEVSPVIQQLNETGV